MLLQLSCAELLIKDTITAVLSTKSIFLILLFLPQMKHLVCNTIATLKLQSLIKRG